MKNNLEIDIEEFKDLQSNNVRFTKEVEQAEDNIQKPARDDKTRNTLTLSFILGFFGLLVFSCVFVLVYNNFAVKWAVKLNQNKVADIAASIHLLELDKVLSIMIGALGTSLGFIIGYYFKEKNK
ncbi:hypothetical protein QPJ96_05990 [Pantoea agglomerans]|uniref:hypothetical protein n=1 Tax=Pantoea sp. EKM20T TaxID=2708059 RepID=UPI00142D811B|nr:MULTISPECIES: hypothetical protein [Pantoea]KAF6685019.1 hypothetical protein HFD94_04670 [Pantoea sp. EKM20T]WIL43100.1 hypothetical protein QPJ96_05990 [Pantoea agglomerans]